MGIEFIAQFSRHEGKSGSNFPMYVGLVEKEQYVIVAIAKRLPQRRCVEIHHLLIDQSAHTQAKLFVHKGDPSNVNA